MVEFSLQKFAPLALLACSISAALTGCYQKPYLPTFDQNLSPFVESSHSNPRFLASTLILYRGGKLGQASLTVKPDGALVIVTVGHVAEAVHTRISYDTYLIGLPPNIRTGTNMINGVEATPFNLHYEDFGAPRSIFEKEYLVQIPLSKDLALEKLVTRAVLDRKLEPITFSDEKVNPGDVLLIPNPFVPGDRYNRFVVTERPSFTSNVVSLKAVGQDDFVCPGNSGLPVFRETNDYPPSKAIGVFTTGIRTGQVPSSLVPDVFKNNYLPCTYSIEILLPNR